MATVGEALHAIEGRLFVGRERELAVFRRWLADEDPLPPVLELGGPGGVGKTALMEAFSREAHARGRTVMRADGRDFRPTPDGLVAALGGDSLDALVERLNAQHPLVLLDTFELAVDLTRFLLEELLPRLEVQVRVVVASRYPMGPSARPPWNTLIRSLAIPGFTAAESRTYLQRRGVTDADLVAQLLAATRGFPLGLSLAGELVQQLDLRNFSAAPEWALVVRRLVDTLLRGIDDPLLRELLVAASVLRQFDQAALAAVLQRNDIGAAFERLCGLSLVRPSAHGLMLLDEVRSVLADDLQWREPDRFRELRQRVEYH